MTEKELCYVLVGNIPFKFHSVDLRSFFSQFIETEKFDCFHFRHRPEVLKRKIDAENGGNSENSNDFIKGKTTCCVVRVKKENVKELLEIYDGENWTDKEGKLCVQKAVISRINTTFFPANVTYKTRKEEQHHKKERVEFVMDDLLKLSELRPPSFMPNGNIGTSLTTFLGLIRSCQLPPHVIKKLGLSFPSGRSKHCYGNVRFDYGNDANEGGISLCPKTKRNLNEDNESVSNIESDDHKDEDQPGTAIASGDKQNTSQSNIDADDVELPSDAESEPEEDWERHEALHDDVDCQGRTKERLYENKIELKWEKGGSGLVFYTDAAYWESLSGDFDEQTADDWDVDMNIYEKGGE